MSRFVAHCYHKQDSVMTGIRHQMTAAAVLNDCLYDNFVRQLRREVIFRVNQRQPHSGVSDCSADAAVRRAESRCAVVDDWTCVKFSCSVAPSK